MTKVLSLVAGAITEVDVTPAPAGAIIDGGSFTTNLSAPRLIIDFGGFT